MQQFLRVAWTLLLCWCLVWLCRQRRPGDGWKHIQWQLLDPCCRSHLYYSCICCLLTQLLVALYGESWMDLFFHMVFWWLLWHFYLICILTVEIHFVYQYSRVIVYSPWAINCQMLAWSRTRLSRQGFFRYTMWSIAPLSMNRLSTVLLLGLAPLGYILKTYFDPHLN